MIIAIDGPSGAGKSTISKKLAKMLAIDYIDTGAMFRAIAYYLVTNNIDANDEKVVSENLDNIKVNFKNGKIYLNDKDISDKIRDEEIGKVSSKIASYGCVREKLVNLQRLLSLQKSVILDGRDIGTVVFPNADYKFFLTASVQERAKRRVAQLEEMGKHPDYDQILQDIIKRDKQDKEREIAPLKKASDAIEVDTTHMSLDKTLRLLHYIVSGAVHW